MIRNYKEFSEKKITGRDKTENYNEITFEPSCSESFSLVGVGGVWVKGMVFVVEDWSTGSILHSGVCKLAQVHQK